MKQFFAGLLVGLLITALFISGVADSKLKLIVDGRDITDSAEPIIHNNKTYTPVKAVAEALGATVRWNASTKTVSISSNSNSEIVVSETDTDSDFLPFNGVYKYDTEKIIGLYSDAINLNKVVYYQKESTPDVRGREIFSLNKYLDVNGQEVISKLEFIETYNRYVALENGTYGEDGYLTIKQIYDNYGLGCFSACKEGLHSSMGSSYISVPIDMVNAERANGGALFFVTSMDEASVAFFIRWKENWDYHKHDEILIDESEFLEKYNAYINSK